jgi:hypothetical protein
VSLLYLHEFRALIEKAHYFVIVGFSRPNYYILSRISTSFGDSIIVFVALFILRRFGLCLRTMESLVDGQGCERKKSRPIWVSYSKICLLGRRNSRKSLESITVFHFKMSTRNNPNTKLTIRPRLSQRRCSEDQQIEFVQGMHKMFLTAVASCEIEPASKA